MKKAPGVNLPGLKSANFARDAVSDHVTGKVTCPE